MKRILTLLALLGVPLSAQAAYGVGVGYQLGTDDAVAIGIGPWDLGIGTERFVVNLDRRFHTREFPHLYFGLGAQVSENSDAPVGLRTKVGLSARADMVELFGEVVPNVTFGDAGDFDVDYSVGLRIWF